jgi:hypothetical protein
MVSIDWDFFFCNFGEISKDIVIHPGTDQERTIPGKLIYDWGHSEAHSDLLQRIFWQSRIAGFVLNGLEMTKHYNLNSQPGTTDPSAFLSVLQKRFKYFDQSCFYADSHALGLRPAMTIQQLSKKPIKVVHFDAHCDLGYSSNAVKHAKKGQADCSEWLYYLIHHNIVDEVEIVYPDWKGKASEKSTIGQAYLKPHRSKIKLWNWSDWVLKGQGGFASTTFVCRSSAWTPPYADAEFAKFMEGLSPVCLDCITDEKIGAYNACKPREWNQDEADQFARNTVQVHRDFQEKRRIANEHRVE